MGDGQGGRRPGSVLIWWALPVVVVCLCAFLLVGLLVIGVVNRKKAIFVPIISTAESRGPVDFQVVGITYPSKHVKYNFPGQNIINFRGHEQLRPTEYTGEGLVRGKRLDLLAPFMCHSFFKLGH